MPPVLDTRDRRLVHSPLHATESEHINFSAAVSYVYN